MLPSAVGVKLATAIYEAYASMPIDGMSNPTGNSPSPRPSGSIQQGVQPPVQQPPVQQPPVQQPPVQQPPVQQPPVPGSMEDIQARQRAYEAGLERQRVLERVRLSAQAHQHLAQFSNATSINDVVIVDPTQIGVRGYIPGGPNQPFARNLANELVNQDTVGVFKQPSLDPNARRFLAAVLPGFRPEVYGPNATLARNTPMISRGDITKLRNLN